MSKKVAVSNSMHYTVVFVLIISVITTFLLGMLLTEVIFNTGLDYFSGVARQTRIEKSKAQMVSLPAKQEIRALYPASIEGAFGVGYELGCTLATVSDSVVSSEIKEVELPELRLSDAKLLSAQLEVTTIEEISNYDQLKSAYELGFINGIQCLELPELDKLTAEDNVILLKGMSLQTLAEAGYIDDDGMSPMATDPPDDDNDEPGCNSQNCPLPRVCDMNKCVDRCSYTSGEPTCPTGFTCDDWGICRKKKSPPKTGGGGCKGKLFPPSLNCPKWKLSGMIYLTTPQLYDPNDPGNL